MKACLMALGICGLATVVQAQPRPGAFSTLTTSDTGVTSACIGANAIPPATCLGGIQFGPGVVNQALTIPTFIPGVTTNKLYSSAGTLFWNGAAVAVGGAVGPGTVGTLPVFSGVNSIGNSIVTQAGTVITIAGTLQSTGFGASDFIAGGAGANSLRVTNTTNGVANLASLIATAGANSTALNEYSTTFTTAGSAVQAGGELRADGAGGLSLAAVNAAGLLRFYTGGSVERGQITAAGLFAWETFGAHGFSAGGAGGNTLRITNTTAGAGNSAGLLTTAGAFSGALTEYSSSFTTAGYQVQSGASLSADGPGGLSLAATDAAGAVRIYSGSATLRATYFANGDYSFGGSGACCTDSFAVVTVLSGFGTGASILGTGRGFAFRVLLGTTPGTTGTVSFNNTIAAPVCVAVPSSSPTALVITSVQVNTTTVTVNYTGAVAADIINVLCRGVPT